MPPDVLVLASRNAKKVRELAEILAPVGVRVRPVSDYPGVSEVEETGSSFEENAALKACAVRQATGLAALADDSGLVVDALGGEPGIRSARYAGPGADDAANNRLLLERLASVPEAQRTARFVCAIAYAPAGGGEPVFFRGETGGRMLRAPRGANGFGYDPLFLSDDLGVTFAEAGAGAKHEVSHRGRALAAFLRYFQA